MRYHTNHKHHFRRNPEGDFMHYYQCMHCSAGWSNTILSGVRLLTTDPEWFARVADWGGGTWQLRLEQRSLTDVL